MTFSKNQIKKLKPLERVFSQAVNDYKGIGTTNKENDTVYEIYREAFPEKANNLSTNWSCSTCLLKLYKAVGIEYFRSIKETGGEG